MIRFTTVLERFQEKGEKTGWTYIRISAAQATKLKSKDRTSFRVKGSLDTMPIKQLALLPMGEGNYILPVNGTMRRKIGKTAGDKVIVELELDTEERKLSADLITCLDDDPIAQKQFNKLPPSHQRYFSNWIEEAKTAETKSKRIFQAIQGLSMGFDFGETVRHFKKHKD